MGQAENRHVQCMKACTGGGTLPRWDALPWDATTWLGMVSLGPGQEGHVSGGALGVGVDVYICIDNASFWFCWLSLAFVMLSCFGDSIVML